MSSNSQCGPIRGSLFFVRGRESAVPATRQCALPAGQYRRLPSVRWLARVLCVLAMLPASAAFADIVAASSDSGQVVGLGMGALAGAALGGPPGMLLGAGVGLLLGRESESPPAAVNRATTPSVAEARAKSGRSVVAVASPADRQSRLALRELARGYLGNVHFRTGSTSIEPHAVARLQRIAAALRNSGDWRVYLDGHADIRGGRRFNRKLSLHRAGAVRDVLMEAGIPGAAIMIEAHGYDAARYARGDRDGYALDRRVSIHIAPKEEA